VEAFLPQEFLPLHQKNPGFDLSGVAEQSSALVSAGPGAGIATALQQLNDPNGVTAHTKSRSRNGGIQRLARHPQRLLQWIGPDAAPITVALIDSGIDTEHHQEFGGHLWMNPKEQQDGIDNSGDGRIDDITGWDFVGNDPLAEDQDGHGTMMAGLVMDAAPTARLMNLRVLDAAGEGSMVHVSQAIDYAVEHGAQVINLSLGANGTNSIVAASIDRALGAGVIVVAASGNEGKDRPNFPARMPGVWAAGSLDEEGQPTEWSNGGRRKGNQFVTVLSKHVKSLQINGGTRFVSGTSAAAARLSGLFASLLSLRAGLG